MARNIRVDGETNLDLEHELPEAEQTSEPGAQETMGAPANISATEADAELEKVRTERDSYLDRLARLQAEFDNFRKRNAREQQDYRDYALTDAVKQLLPILDSLDRALKTENANAGDFRSGIELIDRQFHDALAKLGVQPIEAVGQPFDPNLHQAIQTVESDQARDNHVVDELQRGYRIKDRLLRPAMVRVAQNPRR